MDKNGITHYIPRVPQYILRVRILSILPFSNFTHLTACFGKLGQSYDLANMFIQPTRLGTVAGKMHL